MRRILIITMIMVIFLMAFISIPENKKKPTPTPYPTYTPYPPYPTPMPNGLSGYEQIHENHSIIAGTPIDAIVYCSPGKIAIGGGYQAPPELDREQSLIVSANGPLPDGTGWMARIYHYTLSPRNFNLWVICADAPE